MDNFLVIGLGRSGISVTNYLIKNDKKVFIYDKDKKLMQELTRNGLVDKKAQIMPKLCVKSLSIIQCIVLSPGVPLDKKIIKIAQKLNIEIIGELAFSAQFCKGEIVAVTGTNGKTSTVNLLKQILDYAQVKNFLLGNVGTPLSSELDTIEKGDKVILEVSSFQLEYCKGLNCACAGFLNIAPDHLNRYKDFNDYFNTKAKLLYCVKAGGKCFFNYDDILVRDLGKNRDNAEYFSLEKLPKSHNGIFLSEGSIFKKDKHKTIKLLDVKEFKLLGEHNFQNLLCAVSMALFLGVAPKQIEEVLPKLTLPRHRIEFVAEVAGVKYYNDSKATNCNSTKIAINSFKQTLWLLLGGSDKGEKFDDLIKELPSNINLVTFGQTGKKIFKCAKKYGIKELFNFKNLTSAFDFVKFKAQRGEVVLLSPACASFDEFSNFEERGDYFCNLVMEFKGEK